MNDRVTPTSKRKLFKCNLFEYIVEPKTSLQSIESGYIRLFLLRVRVLLFCEYKKNIFSLLGHTVYNLIIYQIP